MTTPGTLEKPLKLQGTLKPRRYDPDKWTAYEERQAARFLKRKKSSRIIAIDGEGVGRPTHRYTLLAASNGKYIEHHSLPTTHCFEFLFELPSDSLIVGYSINYDVNMILKDLPREVLEELWVEKSVKWRFYSIRWLPSKRFSVTRMGETRVVWDVFGFFQCSFVKALKEWQVGTPEQIHRISTMKDLRGEFSEEQNQRIREYCFEECSLLVQVVQKLLDCCKDVELSLRSYHGAGSVANAILSKYHVKQFIGVPPQRIFERALQAYFGGRFEISQMGIIEGPVFGFDIRSAYPSQCRFLPCLSHGKWRRSKQITDFGVYEVRYNLNDQGIVWGPLPYRYHNNRIIYPTNGHGWYWGSELKAAQKLYPGKIIVEDGYVYTQECDHQPFHFVENLFEQRRILKAQDNFGQMVLKLGLNSLYGKTAQSVGQSKNKPPYQSFIWAGMITAGTRAQILNAIALNPSAVVSIATDGIISTEDLKLDQSDKLGDWERSGPIDSVFLLQPGVYAYRYGDTLFPKTRGFGIRELDFGRIQTEFLKHGWRGHHVVQTTRFRGLGTSLAAKNGMQEWRRWITTDKTMFFRPVARVPEEIYKEGEKCIEGTRNYKLLAMPVLDGIRPAAEDTILSSPYKMKTEWENMFDESGQYELQEALEQPELFEV